MNKTDLLKLFYKYGFYSLRKEPFLYEGSLGLGICYSFRDSFYGFLTRLYIPKDLEDAEDFFRKYYWYKKNGLKYQVCLKLSDYKVVSPDVTFEKDGHIYTYSDLNDLLKIKKEKNNQDKNYMKKIRRTVFLLIQIMEEKIHVQEETYQNLIQLTNSFIDKENELLEKVAFYQGKQFVKKEYEKVELKNDEIQEQISEFYDLVSHSQDQEELEKLIYTFAQYIQSLEMDEGYLKNKYELIRLPLQIKVIKQKLDFLYDFSNRKKSLFGKKEDVLKALDLIEEKTPLKEIVTFEHYKQNEIYRIQEKYAIISDLDIRTVGDFLMEFDNLKLKEPVFEEDTKEQEISFENIMEQLEVHYQNRSKKDQDFLVSYSYLKKYIVENKIEEFLTFFQNPSNIMMKIKYFKDIDFSSVSACKKSIEKFLGKIKMIEPFVLPGNMNVFWVDGKVMTDTDFLKTSSKRFLAPIQRVGENDVTYIGHLMKGTSVYFVPYEIVEDVYNDGVLILSERKPFVLIDLQNNFINEVNSDILKVVNYEEKTFEDNKLTIVSELQRKQVSMFKKVVIERKENESN